MQSNIFLFLLLLPVSSSLALEKITPRCSFEPGPINGVLIERDGTRLVVYGWSPEMSNVERVLLPHGRRDLVWKARALIAAGPGPLRPLARLLGW